MGSPRTTQRLCLQNDTSTEGTIKIGEKGAVSISSPKGCWGDGYTKSASFEHLKL